jgi:hypothetical protein
MEVRKHPTRGFRGRKGSGIVSRVP